MRAAASRALGEPLGQASVEAAVLLPVVTMLLVLLLQPACALYTRSVMQGAAAEGLRVLATRDASGAGTDEACRAYVLRRLRAVPEVAAFHTGGPDAWEVTVEGDAASGEARVEVAGRFRPLPLVGGLACALGEPAGDEVVLRVSVGERTRPTWLEGDYGSWVEMWG